MTVPLAILPQIPAEIQSRKRILPAGAQAPSFALYTLGCKVNQYDSHQIARMLVASGFRRTEFREVADLYVIDTCTVTAEADRKSRKAAGRARRNNPDGLVAVTGCAATRDALQFLSLVPDALVLSNADKFNLPELALARLQTNQAWAQTFAAYREETASEPVPSATRERAVVKIQDGCDHKCSYCIIPSVRGASRLKSRQVIMNEARAFVREGARELVVTGVSLGDWHQTGEVAGTEPPLRGRRGRNRDLCALLAAIGTIEGLERVRVSSLDPADVDEEWLQAVASTPRLCPHIHLALQSGSASTLRRMRRRYSPELFLKWAHRWREICPQGGLTTDVIVGFPGETDAEFQESLAVARAAAFSAVHVFPYSPRAGTEAAGAIAALGGAVSPAVQAERVAAWLELGASLSGAFAEQFLGTEQEILLEQGPEGMLTGLTPHYVRAAVPAPEGTNLAVGDLAWFRATAWDGQGLTGELVGRVPQGG